MQIINNTGAIIGEQINLGNIDILNIDDLFKDDTNNKKMKNKNYPNWLVPLEIAKELKEIGFDEPCIFSYSEGIGITACIRANSGDEPNLTDFIIGGNSPGSPLTDIPTFEQVFSWFRKKGYKANIDYVFHADLKCKIGYLYEIIHNFSWECYSNYFETYEIARKKCLKDLIKFYKNENK